MIRLIIKGEPVPKGRPRFTRRGFAYTPKKTRDAERMFLSQAIKHAPEKPLEGALSIQIKFFKPKPKSKPKNVIHWTTRPDLDNFIKIIDALNGVFWLDDSQIVEMYATKEYGDPARTEIIMEEIKNDG